MRILLILASDLIYKYENIFTINNSFAPLSLTILAASVPEKYNAEIRIVDEGMEKVNYDKLNFDIVGISCCASSSDRAYKLSEYWKKRGAFTFIGGHHATLCPDEVAEHCDSVISGFGEYVLPQLIEDIQNGTPQKIYRATCVSEGEYITPRRDLIKHLNYYAPNTIYATRGCSNNCSYCSVSTFTKSHHLRRPIEDIVNEIKNEKFKEVYFMDSNLIADIDYAKELMTALIPLKIKYYTPITYNVFKNKELLELMQKSGCFHVFIGFESFYNSNLQSADKEINQVKEYKQCVQTLHEYGISVTGGFMVGMEYDDEESIKSIPQKVNDLGVDLIRYTLFTPLPGTKTFQKYKNENRLLTLNYDYYDLMHVVHKPERISPEKLQELYRYLWDETYSFKNIFNRIRKIKQKKFIQILENLYFRVLGKKIPSKIDYKNY